MSTTRAETPRSDSRRSTNKGHVIKSRSELDEQYNAAREAKLEQRRFTWRVNSRLLIASLAVVAVGAVLAAISYFYFSASTANTFLQLAETAESEKDFSAQAKWLQRYSLVNPEDHDAIYKMALAADRDAALAISDQLDLQELGGRIDASRRSLSLAIGPVGAKDRDKVADLRRRLIRRLLQLGGRWNREAEQQIVLLDAAQNDPQALVSICIALVGQLQDGSYQTRYPNRQDAVTEDASYWEWLANQKVGYVLATAFKQQPDNIELASHMLTAPALYSEQFSFDDQQEGLTASELAELKELALKTLGNSPASRAKLILGRHLAESGDLAQATEVLAEAAEAATARLQQVATPPPATASQDVAAESASSLVFDDSSEAFTTSSLAPAVFWDYLVVYESASILSESNPQRSLATLQTLLAIDLPRTPPEIVEKAYLLSGSLQASSGDVASAVRTLSEGVEQSGGNSVPLLSELAHVQRNSERYAELVSTTEQLADAIEKSKRNLAGELASGMDQAERVAAGRYLDSAGWMLDVMRGTIAKSQGDSLTAMRIFDEAMRSSVDVDSSIRVAVADDLASLQREQGMWDQAAYTLDRASLLAPTDGRLHLKAAQAWSRTGNTEQAMRHWRSSNIGEMPEIQIAQVQSRLQQEFQLLPSQRDFGSIRSGVAQLRKALRLARETSASNVSQKAGENQAGNGEDSSDAELAESLVLLKAIELTVPLEKQSIGEAAAQDAIAQSLDQLASENVKNARLQAFVAEQLSQLGESELAMKAIGRMETLPDADPTDCVIVKSKVVSVTDPIAAANLLIEQASADAGRSADLLELAAAYANRGADAELVYQALTQIDPANRTLATLYDIAIVAKRLPSGSKQLSVDGKVVSAEQLSGIWEDRLQQREGKEGTYWRFLRASDLMAQQKLAKGPVDSKDPRVVEIKSLLKQVLALRPRWGEAISLNGQVLALEGKNDEAIIQLRRGIAAGDNQISARRLLWKLLILVDRGDEAEEEIRNSSLAHQSDLDLNSAMRIDLAESRGDYTKSMELAQDFAEQNPDDFLSHMILAVTGTTALKNIGDGDERQGILKQTVAAIKRAEVLSVTDSPLVLAMKLDLAVVLDERQQIDQAIARVMDSKMDELPKSRLLARAYFAKKDFDKTLEHLTTADRLDPSSRSQLDLAEFYEATDRVESQIQAMYLALLRDPSDSQLRNRLAQKMVTSATGDKVPDWDLISELLSGQNAADSSNQWMYAVLLGSEALREIENDGVSASNRERLEQSQKLLRGLITDETRSSDDATRFLAMLLEKTASLELVSSKDLDAEIRSLYVSLYDRGKRNPVDIYRYAQYLLAKGDSKDQSRLKNLADEMKVASPATIQCLEVCLQLADRLGKSKDFPIVVTQWAENAIRATAADDPDKVKATAIYSTAGRTMVKLDLVDQSIRWFEKAYQTSSEELAPYIFALTRADQPKRAIDVCLEHFRSNSDPVSATLFLETLLGMKDLQAQVEISKTNAKVVDRAVELFQGDAGLLESVGTLRMTEGDFEGAVLAFQSALKKDPLRIRTLNNLAMAFSEINGRESEGLAPIEAAIELSNQDSELLDTKGVVQLASGRIAEAEITFEKAFAQSHEPRHLFHVIIAQLVQGKESQAKANWGKLDLSNVDLSGLTPNERAKLGQIKSKFSSRL
ncbi:tetratricopeptide repeat protein [Rubripirellula reticaptiva]|uniref:Tetratricopeptide repeat protein n=1 Tax=Rubripirellula reticaptiva TaxID=2528013 RepID=A0A5C6F5A1_9BACT|nr:hypothetical protein [Rubripirellula reticaptiva]TWU55694.1 Tetratricopeptide repeat protein [Rubripirellula reticaptiva]